MKWWKCLIAFDVIAVLTISVLLTINWNAKRHLEIRMLPTQGGNEAWCAVVPSFELLSGSEMTLVTSFWAQPNSNYVISYGDGKPDGNLNVTEGGEIKISHNLYTGWNTVYFSYSQAVPECWTVYSVKLWAPYFRYPWETENSSEEEQPRPIPIPIIEGQNAYIPARDEVL